MTEAEFRKLVEGYDRKLDQCMIAAMEYGGNYETKGSRRNHNSSR